MYYVRQDTVFNGVIVDDELQFHKHVLAAKYKANQTLGIVKRTFETLDEELLHMVCKT